VAVLDATGAAGGGIAHGGHRTRAGCTLQAPLAAGDAWMGLGGKRLLHAVHCCRYREVES